MKKISITKVLLKKVLFVGIFIYVLCTFISQQKTLNSYNKEAKYYEEQISAKLAYQETLENTKNNMNSKEYIEKTAREKLDMYFPTERVYVDKTK